jgi:hypothetical protein
MTHNTPYLAERMPCFFCYIKYQLPLGEKTKNTRSVKIFSLVIKRGCIWWWGFAITFNSYLKGDYLASRENKQNFCQWNRRSIKLCFVQSQGQKRLLSREQGRESGAELVLRPSQAPWKSGASSPCSATLVAECWLAPPSPCPLPKSLFGEPC